MLSTDAPVRRLVYAVTACLVVAADQVTKHLVAGSLPLHSTVTVIPGFFDLTHVKNSGAAFGLFAGIDSPFRSLLLTGVALVVFFGVLLYALMSPASLTRLQSGLALILGGAVGNLIDRLRFESVTDFLRFYLGAHEWPSFNLADSAITVGVLVLAWDIWRRPDEERERSRAASAEPCTRT